MMSAAEPCRSKAPYASGLVLVNACRRVVEEPNVPLLKSPKRSTMVSKMVMKLGRLLVCEDQKLLSRSDAHPRNRKIHVRGQKINNNNATIGPASSS